MSESHEETIDTGLNYSFRKPEVVKIISDKINNKSGRLGKKLKIMEVCGGHTHAILKYGLNESLKKSVEFLHGPGCPVCVIPRSVIDSAIEIARRDDVILATLGDMMRVPGSTGSLQKVRAEGSNVRFLYSPNDVLKIAEENPAKKVVYFAIGFETTTPMSAHIVLSARKRNIRNLFLHVNHVLVPPALEAILSDPEHKVSGFLGPSHVSVITGTKIYNKIVEKYGIPLVVGGFEPVDILEAVDMLFDQFLENRCEVENQYVRAADFNGNLKAQEMVTDVFETAEHYNWRGLGEIPDSSLKLKPEFQGFNARIKFPDECRAETEKTVKDEAGCLCPEILKGKRNPAECGLFKKKCNPENPLGACMVSSEGACAAYYKYG